MIERERVKIKRWIGEMEADYIYTPGIAGERFFLELKNGKILGTRCRRCRIVYLPPRIYCEKCFHPLEEWVDCGRRGKVHTYTIAYKNKNGKPEIIAFIRIADGGLIHYLDTSPEEVEVGMEVEAVFREEEERKGSIMDILHFRPLQGPSPQHR
jgi:hypothetical protein